MRGMYKTALKLFALCLLNISAAAANSIEGNAMNNKKWITYHFGRFEITLPKGSEISADYKIFNENLVLISKNRRGALPILVNQKIE
ncbi:hypothetical protein [Paenibacillus sp.]|uniref:hypothetical protein n=1 Tax=Paenibacillus sp. TaxID=58172 RepID=UPI0028A600BE|nr:hypothetical protein [Paenibacillus sp.]